MRIDERSVRSPTIGMVIASTRTREEAIRNDFLPVHLETSAKTRRSAIHIARPPKDCSAREPHAQEPVKHVKAVSERLGPSSTSFTMDTYAAVIPSMGRAAADAADQLFGEERGK